MPSNAGTTLTLLFTDVVGSTELSARLGDEAAHALRRAHERIVRDQVPAFGGQVVKNTGDGFFATFTSARQGVECGAAIQQVIARQQAEGRYSDLSVRVGLHTGEPVLEAGDVFGIDVAIATRVMSEAQGGEILVSDITRQLARAHTSLAFSPAGARTLKGVPHPVDVHVVEWRALEIAGRRLSRFVGREDARKQLRARLDTASQGKGGLALIAGEPGMGKSRLASEVALEARDRGMLVLHGRAFESEGLPPYHAVTEGLARYLHSLPSESALRLLGPDASHVVRMLPDLHGLTGEGAEPEALGPDAERYRMFEALTACVMRIASDTPLVLVIDDLHWADRAAIHLLQHLTRRVTAAPVLILATYRDLEVDDEHPLKALIDEMRRDGLGELIRLEPLPRDDVAALIADMLGVAASRDAVEALYSAGAGNPLFTEELVRLMREQGYRFDSDPPSRPSVLPESVRNILLRRFERLSLPTRDVLTWCAVLGTDLRLERIALASSRDENEVLNAIEEALDAHVLHEDGDGFAFAHPLIHEMLYGSLSAPRRQTMHRHIASRLEDLYADNRDPHVQELAHHYLEAGSGVSVTAAGYARRAAEQAMAVYAYDEAASYYRRAAAAVESEDSVAAASLRSELLMALGSARVKAGDAPAADDAFRQAAAVARGIGRSDLYARAVLGLGDVRRTGGNIDQVLIDLLRDGLRMVDEEDSALRAILMARLTSALYHVESLPRLREMSDEALSIARRVGDSHTIVQVLRGVLPYLHPPGPSAAKLAHRDELIRLADEVADRETALLERYHKLGDLVEMGSIAQADELMELVSRQADELRQPFFQWLVAVYRAMRALFDGRYAEAESLAQAAFALGREAQTESNLAFQFLAVQLFAIRWEQGRLGELLPTVQDFVRQYPALRWRVGLAFVFSEMGDDETARREYEAVFEHDLVDVPDDFNQLIALTFLSDLCARFDDSPRAALLYNRIAPFDGQNAIIGAPAATVGAASRYLGMLAATMRRWEDADRHFEAALEMNERMRTRPFAARTRVDWARGLFRRDDSSAVERALRLLDDAEVIAHDLAMVRLCEEIASLRLRALPG